MNLWQLFKETVRGAKRKGKTAPKPRYVVEHKAVRPKRKRVDSKHLGSRRHPHGNRRAKRDERKRQKLERHKHRFG